MPNNGVNTVRTLKAISDCNCHEGPVFLSLTVYIAAIIMSISVNTTIAAIHASDSSSLELISILN